MPMMQIVSIGIFFSTTMVNKQAKDSYPERMKQTNTVKKLRVRYEIVFSVITVYIFEFFNGKRGFVTQPMFHDRYFQTTALKQVEYFIRCRPIHI